MSAHVDLDLLAEHLEGLLDDEAAAGVEVHLASCATCRARVDDLRGVSDLLGRQQPPPMPEQVLHRLEQAIRDDGAVSLDRARRRRTRRVRVLLAAAAAVVVVAVGGTVGDTMLSGSNSGEAGRSGAVSDRAEPAPEAASEPGVDAQGGVEAPQDAPDTGAPPALTPQERPQASLIERIYRTRAGRPLRERAGCVGAALGDPGWAGTSYTVQVQGRAGAVAFVGDPGSTQREITGVLVTCGPKPRVLERAQLSP